MNMKLILISGVLVLGASLQAGTTYTLNFSATGYTNALSNGDEIGPYTGSTFTGKSALTNGLICDDFSDAAVSGTVYVTNVASGAIATDTRYGTSDPSPYDTAPQTLNGVSLAAYGTGTTLYEEMAWLGQQMIQSGESVGNIDQIQEALWIMTYGGTLGATGSPNASGMNYTTTGSTYNYAQWIQKAEADYNQTNMSGFANLQTSNWFVVTDVSAAGCTVGTNGSTGCALGTAGTGTSGQEYLMYNSSGQFAATPEPASFILIGSGLLAGGFFGRRRMKRNN
jgi:hypothetical protein